MKNLQLLFVGILMFISQLGIAQLERGTLQIGGTAGFDVDFEDGGDNPFTIMLNPTIASFISDNLSLGTNIGLAYLNSGDFSATALNLLPLVRYYVPAPGKSSAFFFEVKAGLALANSSYGDESSTETAFQAAGGPGVAFFISDCVSIDALLAYNRITGDLDQSSLGLNIGLQMYLSRKKK